MDDRGASADRGISTLVGFIFVFAVVMITVSVFQAVVVPQQNQAVEFAHNQQVQADMQTARGAIIGAVDATGPRSIMVELGTTYPSRLVFVNPVPPAGSLSTRGTSTTPAAVTLTNASAAGNVGDYWNGSERQYATATLHYQPEYNQYQTAPRTSYENSVVYNRFEDTILPLSSQALIDGRTITLVTLNGSVDAAGFGSHALDVQPVSASSTTVALTDDGGNVTVSIPTRLSVATWRTLLDGEFVANGSGGHIVGLHMAPIADSPFDELTIELVPETTYELRMAKVGIGRDATGVDPEYVVDVAGNQTTVPAEGSRRLVVEARDRYNNPLSGVNVTFTTADGTFEDGSTTTVVTTDAAGQASVGFTASTLGDVAVTAGMDSDRDGSLADEPAAHTAVFQLAVRPTGHSSAYTVNNPTDVAFNGSEIVRGQGNQEFLHITVENAGDTAQTIEQLRVDYYHAAGTDRPANWSEHTAAPGPHEIAGPYATLSPSVSLAPGDSHVFEFEFVTAAGANYAPETGDHVVLSVVLDDGTVRTYAIQPDD